MPTLSAAMPRIAFPITAFLALLGACPAMSAPPPRRIVSLNLCTDQYLLALADRDRIAGVTRFAADPAMSAAAASARGLRAIRGSSEDVLALAPDLVLAMPGQAAAAVALAGAGRFRTLELPPADSYGQIRAQIRQVATAIGRPARGEALVRSMDADLARLPRPSPRGVAAYYQRRGYLTGTGTLIDELMRRAGLANLATRLGRPALSRLSLEALIAARPDYLIVETDRVSDQGTEMLRHPILRPIPRLILPEAWTVCGGPAYVSAARSLAAQLAKHGRRRD